MTSVDPHAALMTQAQKLVWSGTTRAGTACHQEKAKRVNQGMILAGKP